MAPIYSAYPAYQASGLYKKRIGVIYYQNDRPGKKET